MKKKNTKKFLIRRVIAIVILVMLIIGVKKLSYNFSVEKQREQTRLLFNNEFIQLSSNIYVEDSVIYISEEDVKKIFDYTIYYNVGDKELITTYNKHVAVMHLDEQQVNINDSVVQTKGKLKEIDSKIYLPITDLEIVYDIETEFSNQTNMVIMNSTTKAKKQVMALQNTKIHLSKNPFSITVEKVNRGDYLYVIEESSSYKKVRTTSRKHRVHKK